MGTIGGLKAPAFAFIMDEYKDYYDWETGEPIPDYEGEFVIFTSCLAPVKVPAAKYRTWFGDDGKRRWKKLEDGF